MSEWAGAMVTYDHKGRAVIQGSDGEVTLWDLDESALAGALESVREFKAEVERVERAVADEVVRRLDLAGKRSATLGGCKVEVNAPEKLEWDRSLLLSYVADLIERGKLPGSIAEEIMVPIAAAVKIDGTVARRLLNHPDPDVRARVEECVNRVPSSRTVKLK